MAVQMVRVSGTCGSQISEQSSYEIFVVLTYIRG
jgi:hypothetical protein